MRFLRHTNSSWWHILTLRIKPLCAEDRKKTREQTEEIVFCSCVIQMFKTVHSYTKTKKKKSPCVRMNRQNKNKKNTFNIKIKYVTHHCSFE